MSNQYYTHGSFPSTGAAATSASMRAELDLVSAGFDKLPGLTGNANKFVVINSTATGLTTTDTLPIATVNDNAFTFQDEADNSRKFQFRADGISPGATRYFTMPDADTTLVGTDTTQTLTNKTLTSPVIGTIVNTGTLTLPTSTDTLVGRNTTDTLTNKTLTNPVISQIINTGTLVLPTTNDTLVGRATSDTLTNKTISGATNVLSNIANASLSNSAVTIGSSSLSLGGTLTALQGVSISGAVNTLTNIPNTALVNSGVTFNGTTVALGGSATIKASTTNALTIGNGLSGTSFDGGSAVTIAINTGVTADLSTAQTFSNKTISGAANTLTNIGNASLTNSQVTIGSTAISLGATSTTLAGLASVTVTGDPTAALQLATKQYVDNVAQGLNVKASVAWSTTANISLLGLATQVGGEWPSALNANDRILVKNQTVASQNGIYAASATGWSRTADADTWNELVSAFVFVSQGATMGDTGWVCTADPGGTLGTNNLPWSQFSGAGTYTAGTNLTLTGTQFALASSISGLTGVSTGTLTSTGNTSLGTIVSHLLFTDNTYDIGAVGATRPRSLYLASNAVIGTTLATGGPSDGGISLYVRNTNLTGTAQYGAYLGITASSASTSRVTGAFIRNGTAAASFTTTYSAGIEIGDATKGAGSTITSQYGIYINDMTVGDYNYGLVSNVSSGSNKYNIYANGTAPNYFAGIVGIGQTPATNLQLAVTGTTRIVQSVDNAALGSFYSFYVQRSANDSRLAFGYTTANGYWNISASYGSTGAYAPIALCTSDTVQAILSTDGKFGVGVAPTSYKIHAQTTGSNSCYVAAETTTAGINAGFVAKSTAATWIMGTNIGLSNSVWELYNGGTLLTVNSSAVTTIGTSTVNYGGISQLSVGGTITAGSSDSTSGSTLLQNRYNGANNQFVTLIGEEYSTGAVSINYALRNSTSDTGFTSSADNAPWYRAYAKVGGSQALRVGGAATATSTAVGSTQATNEFFRVLYDGSFLIGRTSMPSGISSSTLLSVGGGASFGGGTNGVQIGAVGDNSSYDGIKMYSLGYNGGAPTFVFTPTTTPGSGVLNTRFQFNNSNGTSTSANNLAVVQIEGGLQVGYSGATSSGLSYRLYVVNDNASAGIYSSGWNHFISSGNEFNFTNSYTSATDVYLNYRSGGGSNAYVAAYRFMNGAGSYQACYASAFTPTSDYRVKSDIQEVGSVIGGIMALRVVNYAKQGVVGREYGLLAHEADPHFPDIVRGAGKDAVDEEGDMIVQGVDYMGLAALLTKGMQEQQAMIEQLKAEVAALKGA